LSSALCSEHKSDTILEIKERIAHGLDCYVSATQCIEAGVDLDFPSGMRECAPLPSVIQTAGRINRNGKSIGEFHVFVLDDNAYPGTVYRNESYVTRTLFNSMV
jgi:CRISPR-associated endonuclease/helicase Cas3